MTHNMDAVERYCSRAMLINEGKIVKVGDPSEVAQMYSDLNFEKKRSGSQKKLDDKKDLHIESFAVVNDKIADTINANKAEKVTIRSLIASKKSVEDAVFGLIIYNSAGMPLFATNTRQTNQEVVINKDSSTMIDVEIDNIFSNGEYVISSSLKSRDGMETYFAQKSDNTFFISGRKHEFAIANPGYKIKID